MFNTKETEVVVIGAGPVGMMSALVLNRLGIKVLIIDGAERVATRSNATLLHPSSLELFHNLGLLERIMQTAFKIENIEIHNGHLQNRNLKLSQLKSPFPFLASLPQTSLEIILERELEREGIPILWNYKAIDCIESDNTIEIEAQHYSEQSIGYAVSRMERMIDRSLRIRAKYAIAADGHNSLMRKRIGLDLLQGTPIKYFLMFDIKSSGSSKNIMRLNFDQGLASAHFPLSNQVNRFMFQFKGMNLPEDYRTKSRDPLQGFFEPIHLLDEANLRSLFSQYIPWDACDIERILWRVAVPFEQKFATNMTSSRCTLLGDAARTFEPLSAASLNLGLQEALEVCTVLSQNIDSRSLNEKLNTLADSFALNWQIRYQAERYSTTNQYTDDWVASNRNKIISSLPASGVELEQLAKQLSINIEIPPPAPIHTNRMVDFTSTSTLKGEHQNHVT